MIDKEIIESLKKYVGDIENLESETQKFVLDDGRKFMVKIERIYKESHIDLKSW